MFQSLVLFGLLPRRLRQILFVHPAFISLLLLHESCSPICKYEYGFLNHVIWKPEALDIRVSKSSLVWFVTEELRQIPFVHPAFISLWLLHESCRPICKYESGFLNHVFWKPEALDIRVSKSSRIQFVTEELAADSVRPPSFHLALALSWKL